MICLGKYSRFELIRDSLRTQTDYSQVPNSNVSPCYELHLDGGTYTTKISYVRKIMYLANH